MTLSPFIIWFLIGAAFFLAEIGKRGVVSREISPALDGEVKLMGSFWRAADDSVIEEGAPVEVTGQASPDGLTLKVRRI